MNVLVACEESQTVTKAFRALGHNAYSCDLQDCSGGHPEWHFNCDVFEVIEKRGGLTQSMENVVITHFDLMIAHPPCTYLAVSGARHLYNKDGTENVNRFENQTKALAFVKALMDVDIKHICIENPISVISTSIRKPTQIIQPYFFGDSAQKSTCLWLKNLPKLYKTKGVSKGEFKEWIAANGTVKRQALFYYESAGAKDRQKIRSKTFEGIAKAMASQWSFYIKHN